MKDQVAREQIEELRNQLSHCYRTIDEKVNGLRHQNEVNLLRKKIVELEKEKDELKYSGKK
jgi:hypothetical protein